jgi:hypothetical protein
MWTETALGDLPAGRFLDVMQKGFARSLGVTCTHCHDPRSWDSEAKPQKEIARRMVKLVGAINDQLAAIPNLSEPRAHVGCATCHRGEVRPAGAPAPPPPAAPTPIAPTAPTAPAATPPPGSR